MSEEPPIMIGPLPAEEFITRRIRFNSKIGRKKLVPAWLVRISGRKLEIQTPNHRNTMLIDPKDASPWWSATPDLKEKLMLTAAATPPTVECRPYGCMCDKCVARYMAEAEAQEAEAELEAALTAEEIPPTPEVSNTPEKIEEPMNETPEPQPAPPPAPAAPAELSVSYTRVSQPRMIISENVHPGWLDVYSRYLHKHQDIAAAGDILREAQRQADDAQRQVDAEIASQQELLLQLRGMGVEIEGTTPAVTTVLPEAPEPPVASRPLIVMANVNCERIARWMRDKMDELPNAKSRTFARNYIADQTRVSIPTINTYLHQAAKGAGLRADVRKSETNSRGPVMVELSRL